MYEARFGQRGRDIIKMQKIAAAGMRMLRWSTGITRKDKIRNDVALDKVNERKISDKLIGQRLRWFGHVERRRWWRWPFAAGWRFVRCLAC